MYKILHITNSLGTGGAERLIADLTSLLDKDRFRVSVCCTGPDGKTRETIERAGSEVIVLNRARRSSVLFPAFCADVLSLYKGIMGVIEEQSPDLVHTHLEANYIAPFCARRAGVKGVVLSFHSSVLLARRGKWSLRNAARRAVMSRAARSADALMAGSKYAAVAAAELCGLKTRDVTVIRNAVDVARVEDEAPHTGLRGELGLPPGEKLLVTLGTVKEPKNHRLLIEAMALLKESRDDVSAVIVGTGGPEFAGGLKALASRLGLDEKVFFLGYREDAYGVVKACDLMVLPSLWEGLPVAALEGMACGVPVLLSDIPPHRELIEEGRDGWLFRSNDRTSLSGMLAKVLQDEESMKKVALAGYMKVVKEYNSVTMARNCERLYERCIERGAGGR
jgi:glycosyltransferase involved in cell wall biosynthesis